MCEWGDRARGAAVAVAVATAALAAAPGDGRGQETGVRWNCFRSWTVNLAKDSEPFRVDRTPWALRWRRTTPAHSDLDGLFAELFRVTGDGEKTEDQVAAVNTDHEGAEGTVTVDEAGRFWLHMESWSEETGWRLEACVPADSAAGGVPRGPAAR